MIRLKGIEKSYITGSKALKVLKGLDLEVKEGEIGLDNGFFRFRKIYLVEYTWNFG